MEFWIYLAIFVIIFTIYSFIGIKCEKREDDYVEWCNELLLECGFDPPQLFIMKGGKCNTVKKINGVAYIYLNEQRSDMANKKTLVYLISYLTTDFFKEDSQYYTNMDHLMSVASEKEGFDRLSLKMI